METANFEKKHLCVRSIIVKEQIPPCMCCNKYHGYSDVYLYDSDRFRYTFYTDGQKYICMRCWDKNTL